MYTQTRLSRSATDKVIGGVCGGLAQYFGTDPAIVRLVFVVLVFAGGISVLLYPVLWLIMPAADTGRPAISGGWQGFKGQVGEGTQSFRSTVGGVFHDSSSQPRFDPQTGQPLPTVDSNRNRLLGIVLLCIGVIMLSRLIPGVSSIVIAAMLLGGGFYLLRRSN